MLLFFGPPGANWISEGATAPSTPLSGPLIETNLHMILAFRTSFRPSNISGLDFQQSGLHSLSNYKSQMHQVWNFWSYAEFLLNKEEIQGLRRH